MSAPVRAADPVIETRTVRVVTCPAEVTAPTPAAIAMPAHPLVQATAEVLAWIGARFAREELLAKRIDDARAQCDG
ncbi:hypothetical protein [Sphingomonas sp. TX0522]|uniref:hypothetical protein n=1 Tax=Sphingomonas sp. TX0522 TaxID=2479205 RepID=UPI0018DFD6D1|nr:hypothetical protein [Sphingomonas sp. TX0522]MBI0530074.1 hypothetical protein [Sphingomonas sp. TX0522]